MSFNGNTSKNSVALVSSLVLTKDYDIRNWKTHNECQDFRQILCIQYKSIMCTSAIEQHTVYMYLPNKILNTHIH